MRFRCLFIVPRLFFPKEPLTHPVGDSVKNRAEFTSLNALSVWLFGLYSSVYERSGLSHLPYDDLSKCYRVLQHVLLELTQKVVAFSFWHLRCMSQQFFKADHISVSPIRFTVERQLTTAIKAVLFYRNVEIGTLKVLYKTEYLTLVSDEKYCQNQSLNNMSTKILDCK